MFERFTQWFKSLFKSGGKNTTGTGKPSETHQNQDEKLMLSESIQQTALNQDTGVFFKRSNWENKAIPTPENVEPKSLSYVMKSQPDLSGRSMGQTMGMFFNKVDWGLPYSTQAEVMVPQALAAKILAQNLTGFFDGSNWSGRPRVEAKLLAQVTAEEVVFIDDNADNFFDDIDW